MSLRPSPSLLSAALSLSRTEIDNDSDLLPQQTRLHTLLQTHLHRYHTSHAADLHARLITDAIPPEAPHFRRARHLARPLLDSLPPPLFALAIELLALVFRSPVAAARLVLAIPHCSPDAAASAAAPPRTSRFRAVLTPACCAHDTLRNAHALATCLTAALHFVAALPAAPRPDPAHPPVLSVTLVRAPVVPATHAHLQHHKPLGKHAPRRPSASAASAASAAASPESSATYFDRLRDRLALTLADVSTADLGYPHRYLGSVVAANSFRATADDPDRDPDGRPRFLKHVVSDVITDAFARSVSATILSRFFAQNVASVLRNAIDRHVCTVRIIYLTTGAVVSTVPGSGLTATVRRLSDHVRTFVNRAGIKCLEISVDRTEPWDDAILREALLQGLSASLIVFRFESLPGLSKAIGMSKPITDRFPGLTADPERVLYVDTATEATQQQLEEVTKQVGAMAVERRLFRPRCDGDVLFEKVNAARVSQQVSRRALECKSILIDEVGGPARRAIAEVVHVLNREVDDGEASAESASVGELLFKLKHAVHTKVGYSRKTGSVSVSRGDAVGFSTASMNLNKLLHEAEYGDYTDVTESQPFTVDVRLQLGAAGEVLLGDVGRFARKWGVVTRLVRMVEDGQVLLVVADERKTVLQRVSGRFVTAVSVTVLGGGMDEFLYGKLVRSCIDAVRADQGGGDLTAVRTLLRLVPALGKAARVAKKT